MEVEDIQAIATGKLTGLGVGPNYAMGLVEHAHREFMTPGNTSLHAKLVGIGQSHFASDKIDKLVDSVFENTEQIRKARA